MKKIIWILLLIVIGFALYWFKFKPVDTVEAAKTAPLKVMKHSPAFNNSIDSMMTAYLAVKAAFVEADSAMAKTVAQKFLLLVDSIHLDELKKDTNGIMESAAMQLTDIKASAESLIKQPGLTEMREDFRMVSENIYPLLKTIHYEGPTLYWQNCPMAFGEGREGNWISNTAEIINPYLGKKHPEYKATMLHCGEVKDSLMAQ